ncbi:O-antigen ligase family protein [Flagellimonas sp.]
MLLQFGGKLTTKKHSLFYILLFVVFHLLMFISLIYSKGFNLGLNKTFLFFINYIFLLYPLFMQKINARIIFSTIFWIIIPLSIWFIFQRLFLWAPGSDVLKNPFYELRIFYLNLGALVGLLVLWFFHQRKWELFIFSLIVLLGLSARGPLIFSLLIILSISAKMFLSNVKKVKISSNRLIIFGSSLVCVFSLMFYYSNFFYNLLYENLILKLQGLFSSFDGSIMGRFKRLDFAFENIFESFSSFFFGHGIGSFGKMYNQEEIMDYPHNLFVESWFELGIFGLLLSLIIFFYPFLIKGNHVFKIMALFFLLQGMKSYSLVSIWPIFGFYGILLFNSRTINLTSNYPRKT